MIDNELHTALFELQSNLEDLSSAKQQIDEIKDISTNVILSIEIIQEKYSNHLEGIEKEHKETLDNYINTLTDFIKNITSEHNEIVVNSKKSYSALEKEHKETLNKYKITLTDFIKNITSEHSEITAISKESNKAIEEKVKEFLLYQKNKVNNYHLKLISTTKENINESIKAIKESTQEHQTIFKNQNQNIDNYLSDFESLTKKVNSLINYIEKVNFPDRLDKMDNTISSINIGLQNLQGNINDLQRESKKQYDLSENNNKKLSKNIQIYFILLLITNIIGLVILKLI